MNDLIRWTLDPVGLLAERALRHEVFPLGLWRRTIVGYRPGWNRAVLSDVDTFRSRGSLSGLTPYLRGGVVRLDQPAHDPRRRELNPHFRALGGRLDEVVEARLPQGEFDALEWACTLVRHMLNESLFGGALPDALLARFLAPLDRRIPAPLLPRPRLFRRMRRAVPSEDLRIALAAGYDTTAHTLAWAVWELARHPQWREQSSLPLVINEILRLYPAGWIGSRVARTDTVVEGVHIADGTMVFYSPLLSHRDPALWAEPAAFRPERFEARSVPWAFVPFGGASRTCMGMHLAKTMLTAALRPLCATDLRAIRGDASIVAGITIRPRGPLLVRRRPRRA